MTNIIIKKSIDEWLDSVDYNYLNNGTYVPSESSLQFMNFIKLVNGKQGESHKTPPMHLKMFDVATQSKRDVVNLCFRGAAKTTFFFEYLAPYLGVFNYLPNFGEIPGFIYVSDSIDNGVKSARKNLEFRYHTSDFLQEWLPKTHFTDNYIEFENKAGVPLGIKMFGAKTGLRGTKIFGKRPPLAVLDDLLSDDDAKSRTVIAAVKDTIYKGIDFALDPTRRKVIFNGTPFNKEDPMIEAVESGAYDVNVWPVCERFPCTEEEFQGAWDDRFSYSYVKTAYEKAVLLGKMPAFQQELMLRISSEEERLVQDAEIRWFTRTSLLNKRSAFNFYITTDFATKDTETADFSVISVWAYNANGDWFWVDGVCERQTMDKTFNDLFRLVQEYRPQSVGIEITGQQGAFINLLQTEMMNRNIWFNFASSEKSGTPGIRPITNKLSRFNMVVPWFKAGKMYFPEELKTSQIMGEFIGEIRLATVNGLKGKDDCLDTISQLMYLKAWKPSEELGPVQNEVNRWDDMEDDMSNVSGLSSYIV
ncbi:terminase large subunit [Sinorhizobium phage ort11]|uniref:Terminase large subunit n=1 Tax=Sinorhizobium phage ort11 TaxID=2599764 RepID=A0A5C2H1H3_9CAUD|nr:terminase large subunit [Sinorhizobium phage ort11]QEP29884.1 terminase large subunit [Sinorhizobium phage ort11]